MAACYYLKTNSVRRGAGTNWYDLTESALTRGEKFGKISKSPQGEMTFEN